MFHGQLFCIVQSRDYNIQWFYVRLYIQYDNFRIRWIAFPIYTVFDRTFFNIDETNYYPTVELLFLQVL